MSAVSIASRGPAPQLRHYAHHHGSQHHSRASSRARLSSARQLYAAQQRPLQRAARRRQRMLEALLASSRLQHAISDEQLPNVAQITLAEAAQAQQTQSQVQGQAQIAAQQQGEETETESEDESESDGNLVRQRLHMDVDESSAGVGVGVGGRESAREAGLDTVQQSQQQQQQDERERERNHPPHHQDQSQHDQQQLEAEYQRMTLAASVNEAGSDGGRGTPPSKHRKLTSLDALLAQEKAPTHPLETMQRLAITPAMRRHVLEWLWAGLSALRRDVEVFALAARFFDDFLTRLKVKPKFLQVIAASCALLAADTLSMASPRKTIPLTPSALVRALQAPFSTSDVQRMLGIVTERLGPASVRGSTSLVTYVKALVDEVDWSDMPCAIAPRRVLDDIPEDEAVSFCGHERQQVLSALLHRVPPLLQCYELVSSFRLSTVALTVLLAALDSIFGPTLAAAAVRQRSRVNQQELERCHWRLAGAISIDFSVQLGTRPSTSSGGRSGGLGAFSPLGPALGDTFGSGAETRPLADSTSVDNLHMVGVDEDGDVSL